MVDLPKKKVGIIACSGEEMAEGTVTRLAALRVLEQLRPADTVTICLPLFLAGGEGDRAFARFYPTIAIDGCGKRCAARATEMYSGKPAAGIVVTELVAEVDFGKVAGRRKLNEAGERAVDLAAEKAVSLVDDLLGRRWNRRTGAFDERQVTPVEEVVSDKSLEFDLKPNDEPVVATCSCGSGIPVQKVDVAGEKVTIIALPLIFEQFHLAGKASSASTTVADLLETVKIYNPIPTGEESLFTKVLQREYEAYCRREENMQ